MKNILIAILLLIVATTGCKKNDTPADPAMEPTVLKPTADFNITNMASDNYVVEGKNLKFQVSARNADSYTWDFGNGIKFEGKTPPTDINYIPCGGQYTITLTTKRNINGETATYSKTFDVLCSGRMYHGTHMPD